MQKKSLDPTDWFQRPDIFADLRERLFHGLAGAQDGHAAQLLTRKPGSLVRDPLQQD